MLIGGISWDVCSEEHCDVPKFVGWPFGKEDDSVFSGSNATPTLLAYGKMESPPQKDRINFLHKADAKENIDDNNDEKVLDSFRKELHDRPDLATMVGFPPYEWRQNMSDLEDEVFEVLPPETERELFENMVKDGRAEQVSKIKRILGLRECDNKQSGAKKTHTINLLKAFHQTLKKSATMSPSLKQLAAKSLALIAPTCEALVKSRKHSWIQLSGHAGSFFPAGPDTIWKKRLTKDNQETCAYQSLMRDAVSPMVPKFYAEVDYNNDNFIEIEDLLQHFHDPCVMDIKMGSRTFQESEVKNPAVREDLYEKMVKLDPSEPTPDEHRQRGVTKLRYMEFRERESSSSTLGFRIEGVKLSQDRTPYSSSQLKRTKTRAEVSSVIEKYLQGRETTRRGFVEKLTDLRQLFASSEYFKSHEIIGSSLLLMFDHSSVGVWMIDFAKTSQVEAECCPLTHCSPWALGNHEDGYLTGLDNLLQVFTDVRCT